MNGIASRFVCFLTALLGLVALASVLAGQAAKPNLEGFSLPTDWTHRHVIFSQPAAEEQAKTIGSDLRYWQQWARHNQILRTLNDPDAEQFKTPWIAPANGRKVHRDWAQNLGNRSASAGAGLFPAKFSFSITTANCGSSTTPDFVVFTTALMGSGTQASIVAFDNLYSGCGGTVPSVLWAYNTGGQILTSPVTSLDGSEVAFVQSDVIGHGHLMLLKWKASTTESVGSPGVPTAVGPATYPTCVAPCMTEFSLRSGPGTQTNDTTSSVFIDYSGDIAWVGDSQNWLHKFTGVFRSLPNEVRSAPWPKQLSPGNPQPLGSPVFDHTSKNIFLGDGGGFFYRVSQASGAVTKSGQIDHGTGLFVGPVVDSTAGRVYAFSSNDGTMNCVGPSPCSAVVQFGIAFGGGSFGAKAVVGASVNPLPNPLFEGAFDSIYNSSINATGNLYVCGNTGGPPVLFRIPIAAGAMGAPVAGPVLANATSGCSPVTDIPNANIGTGGTEWIFASVQDSGLPTPCAAGGCITNFKDTPWQASTAYVVGQQILDTHFQIQTVRVAGTSKTGAHPGWNTTIGGTTADNTVRWLNQGPLAASYPTWSASTAFNVNQEIVDSNNNIELVITAGTSKAAPHPVWNVNVNGVTTDNTVRWRNVGSIATAALAAAGGTGGIVMDNVVGSGTLAGASQVYFGTQNNQTCGTSGTGACGVQASQSGLQ